MQTKQNTVIRQKKKLSPQGPQRSRHSVAHVRRRGENIHPQNLILSIYLANIGRQGILVFYEWKN